MTGAHTRINKPNVLRCHLSAIFPKFAELFLYLRWLLCPKNIILPFMRKILVCITGILIIFISGCTCISFHP